MQVLRTQSSLVLTFAAGLVLGLQFDTTADAGSPATKKIDVNGMTMTYVEEGSGEPIVFVHGAVSDLRAWEPIREAISAKHRFIAPTQRYFGKGDWADKGEKFGTATHASDIATFIGALGLGPVHLVGWSMGANIATVVALENPQLVQSVVLFEPAIDSLIKAGEAGNAAREAAGKMFGPADRALKAGNVEKATKLLIEGVFQMPPGGWDSQAEPLRTMQLDNARTMPVMWNAPPIPISCEKLQASDKPVLIIYGGESNAYWPHVAKVMDECLPQGETAVLPNVSHDGPVRDPAGLAAMIEDFVAKH